MSITATRLGSAPLLIDWTQLASSLTPSNQKTELETAWAQLKKRFELETGDVGFFNAPLQEALHQNAACKELVQKTKNSLKGLQDVLILGIGGSALGPLSVLTALSHECDPNLHFHFMENPDPIEWTATLKKLTPENTLVVIVTKSGTTFETLAQALLALEWMTPARWTTHVVAITDPTKGDLRAFAQAHKIPTLEIAPTMGGRFSIFTPVGLFAMALAGLDTDQFLKGATQVRDYCEKTTVEKNPLLFLGQELIRQFSKRPIHVCMPYSTPLKLISNWWVQLWGESLGKDGKGFTPLAALGAVDQHSILQLLRDGPDDKITWFITVDKVKDRVAIPRTLRGVDSSKYPAFALLQGHSLQDILMTEYRAIALVLSKRARPSLTIQLDQIDERSMGALYYALSILTAMTGTLWQVNPFDQPGVEEGKIYIRDSLQKAARDQMDSDDPNSPVNRLRSGSHHNDS